MRGDRSRNPIGGTTLEPSESWLFAQELLGRPVHVPPQPEAETDAQKELREWVDSISTPDKTWGAPLRFQGGNPRTSPAPASETTAKQELREWVDSITRETFNPDLHPRGGFPQNTGMFSPAGGAGGGGKSSRGATPPGPGHGSTDPGQLKRAERTRGVGGHEHSAKTPNHADQVAQVRIQRNPDIDLDPELFLTPKALILTTQDNYEDGIANEGPRYPENHDWNEVAKLHKRNKDDKVPVPDNYRTTAGTFDTQLQNLAGAKKQFDTLVLAGHGGPISPSTGWWVTQPALPDGTIKKKFEPFPEFQVPPGSEPELTAKDKQRLDLVKSLVNKDGRIVFNSCNEGVVKDPAVLKAHIDQMRKNMQMMADYTGREIWAYPEETQGMMIPRGVGSSAWLKVKPR